MPDPLSRAGVRILAAPPPAPFSPLPPRRCRSAPPGKARPVGGGGAPSTFFAQLAGSRQQLRAEAWCYAGRHGSAAAGASAMSWLVAAARRLRGGDRRGVPGREDGWAAAFGHFVLSGGTGRSLLPWLTAAVGLRPAFGRLCWGRGGSGKHGSPVVATSTWWSWSCRRRRGGGGLRSLGSESELGRR